MRGALDSAENVQSTSSVNNYAYPAGNKSGTLGGSSSTTQQTGVVCDPLLRPQLIESATKASHSRSSSAITPLSTPFMVPKYPIPILPSAGLAVPAIPTNNTVPEFLYQLTKMLTGGHKDIIEWSNGKIEVHNPLKLQNKVLHKYFRHSKFASFQRQLNYFGFRKIAGKGKMAPCSYVNEAVTQDIGSLLLIKRKTTTSVSSRDKKNGEKQCTKLASRTTTSVPFKGIASAQPVTTHHTFAMNQNPKPLVGVAPTVSNGTLAPATCDDVHSQHLIAKTAVGRGVRHSYSGPVINPLIQTQGEATSAVNAASFSFPTGVQESLSQLSDNFQNTLNEFQEKSDQDNLNTRETVDLWRSTPSFGQLVEHPTGMLSRDSSLIELAMIPTVDDIPNTSGQVLAPTSDGMHFVDFPHEEINPGSHHINSSHSGSSQR